VSVLGPYEQMRARHRWYVPQRYNIAFDVCDKHSRGKLAMIWEDSLGNERRVLWGELQDLSNRFANLLRSRDVRRGDRVAVMLPPLPETAAAIIGILKIGAVGITMSLLWSDESLKYRLNDSRAKVLITDDHNVDHGVGDVVEQVMLLDYGLLEGVSGSFDTVDTSAEEPAMIYYTSGSMGPPKGVVVAHRSLLGHNEFEYIQDLRENELSYWMGDWAWGVYKILGPWRLGAVNVVYRSEHRYDAEKLLAVLSKYEVTNVFLNPTGIRLMMAVENASERYPQNFRVVGSSNEPLGVRESTWFREQFGVTILESYGMTEAYPMTGNFLTMPVKEGSIGRPVPGWDVQILDENEEPVLVGEQGEICLRARSNPQYPLGYWDRPEKTREDFGGEWFHSKDAAYQDEDGYLWHMGRADDLIKSAGYRISPYEVEVACVKHPAVSEAAVVGSPDERRGQVVKAFLILAEGYEPSEELADEIKKFVRQRHSTFAYPRRIEFVEELPRSQSGKVSRAPLRQSEAKKSKKSHAL
jgi:acetyl-CoA synthetase